MHEPPFNGNKYILIYRCGAGNVIEENRGFYTVPWQGPNDVKSTTRSVFFQAFTVPEGDEVIYTCDFVVCEEAGDCNGVRFVISLSPPLFYRLHSEGCGKVMFHTCPLTGEYPCSPVPDLWSLVLYGGEVPPSPVYSCPRSPPPPPSEQDTLRTGYAADGTPLAVTQEEFLVMEIPCSSLGHCLTFGPSEV